MKKFFLTVGMIFMFCLFVYADDVYQLKLCYKQGGVALRQLSQIKIGADEKKIIGATLGDFAAEIVSFDEKILAVIFFDFPTCVHYTKREPQTGEIVETETIELKEAEKILILPYFENAKTINIYDSQRRKLLSVEADNLKGDETLPFIAPIQTKEMFGQVEKMSTLKDTECVKEKGTLKPKKTKEIQEIISNENKMIFDFFLYPQAKSIDSSEMDLGYGKMQTVKYQVSALAEEVVEFYKNQLSSSGWNKEGDKNFFKEELQTGCLCYVKEGRICTITIQACSKENLTEILIVCIPKK